MDTRMFAIFASARSVCNVAFAAILHHLGQMAKATCPMCKRTCARHPENPSYPFCSAQCKLADLGNWLDARYVVPTQSVSMDDEGDPERGPTTLH